MVPVEIPRPMTTEITFPEENVPIEDGQSEKAPLLAVKRTYQPSKRKRRK